VYIRVGLKVEGEARLSEEGRVGGGGIELTAFKLKLEKQT
jgi:hypothetical protein